MVFNHNVIYSLVDWGKLYNPGYDECMAAFIQKLLCGCQSVCNTQMLCCYGSCIFYGILMIINPIIVVITNLKKKKNL